MSDQGIQRVSFPLPENPRFDEIVDVRAPVEFSADHVLGAINLPVLWDEERKRIGAQYKQESSFEAQKAGAALVSGNIQRHLDGHFSDKPRDYRPLIYCFRGGQRSRSLATVLSEIGWRVGVIEGGYKAYRRHVIEELERLPGTLRFHVINGLTGSGKTLILRELDRLGAQVLDLESLAHHKGSVFGEDLSHPQPGQKRFESLAFERLQSFERARPVYVEAESPKIGQINLPIALRKVLGESPVTELVSTPESRVEFLLADYEEWFEKPEYVLETIDRLKPFHSRETIARWRSWCSQGSWRELIADLLAKHYDQHYGTDGKGNYRKPDRQLELGSVAGDPIQSCAATILDLDAQLPEISKHEG